MQFKDRINILLKEYDLTQQQLADKLGVSQSAVYKWCAGKNNPNEDILAKLANIFSCTTDYLLGLSDNRYKVNDTNIDGTDVVHIGDLTDAQKATIKAIIEDLRKANKN